MTLGELYGETDPNTYDWTDGLIAMCVRKFTKELTKMDLPGVDGRPGTGTSSVTADTTRVSWCSLPSYFPLTYQVFIQI